MAGCKKTTISRQSSYTSLYRNPLIKQKHHRSSSEDGGVSSRAHPFLHNVTGENKENVEPSLKLGKSKENVEPSLKLGKSKENVAAHEAVKNPVLKEFSSGNLQKSSSPELCMKLHNLNSVAGLKIWDMVYSNTSSSSDVWHYSDSESAPASSWSNLPNRSLLCRPLPVDVGRCTCIIVKESSLDGFGCGTFYTLYTYEGKGRSNRKLATAHHRRQRGKSEFLIAQDANGIAAKSDESLVGIITSNIMGSKYHIWDQARCLNSLAKTPKLLAAVKFVPTLSTWTGTYRSMRAWIPKHQSMQLKNTNQIQHINGLPAEWEGNEDRVHQLFSKVPSYNKFSKQYELDFRDKGRRASLKIKSSVKNFQLTFERKGKQTILQMGRLGKSRYVMDYRYPLSGYQAFCMCLASIDSKLCCTV